ADLVGDLERIIRDSCPKSITVRATVARDLSMIVGDPTQLHQVLLNLAVNARDAMPEGGTLTIAAGNVEMDEAFAAAIPDAHAGRYVMLEVSDTGVGIPPEIRDRIFDPFFTTKEPGKGTGLGLSTTAAIVRSHGGAMTLQSAVGRGSTFRVYLPAGAAAEASRGAETPPVAPRGRGEFVLVVDDEPAVRTVAQRTLETFGYRVLTAADGAEAVALFARRHADIALVVTDMMMPVLDGVGTIHALRRIRPDVRVVAASGLAVNGQVARAAEAGVRHFLPKPYTTTELLTVVRAALDE
ncbi:MAG TPA: ATP-binding protein, partial [Gemmatimonadaceae bacterium]|nr:ATP-binding protein [Gemmatimonadaceae bacterium]